MRTRLTSTFDLQSLGLLGGHGYHCQRGLSMCASPTKSDPRGVNGVGEGGVC